MNAQDMEQALKSGRRAARRVLEARDAALETRRNLYPVSDASQSPRLASMMAAVGGRSNEILVAEGDSWFDYPWNDVLSKLEDEFGYEIEEVARRGDRLEDMAYSDGQLAKLIRKIERIIRRGDSPKAVLLSGGGNDIAGEEFHMLLNHRRSACPGINESVAAGIIDERIMLSYTHILSRVIEVCRARLGSPVPVLVHGYGYAYPDGRGFGGGWGPLPGPWLEPGFERKGYSHERIRERRKIIRVLIDRFNERLRELSSMHPFDGVVHYVDIRRELPSTPAVYKKWWANELHPTEKGYARVASRFHQVLATVA